MSTLHLGCFPRVSQGTSNCSVQPKPEVSSIQGIKLMKHLTYNEPSERWAWWTSANKQTCIPSRHQRTKTKRQIQQSAIAECMNAVVNFLVLFTGFIICLPTSYHFFHLSACKKNNILPFFKEEHLFLQTKIHFLNHLHLYACIQNSSNLEFCHILDISWDTNKNMSVISSHSPIVSWSGNKHHCTITVQCVLNTWWFEKTSSLMLFTVFFLDQGLLWDGHIPAPLILEP